MSNKIITFDAIIMYTLDKAEEKLSEREFWMARGWYERACQLYSQHPTGNKVIEARKSDLHNELLFR